MADYQLTDGEFILRTADRMFIPADAASPAYRDYVAWCAAGNVADPAPVTVASTTISATQFLSRFSDTERGMLAGGAQDNPQMLLLLITLAAAGTVDLSDPQVRGGTYGLIGSVLISQARADAILAAP